MQRTCPSSPPRWLGSIPLGSPGFSSARGPMVMSRYRNANLDSPVDTDGWLHTNDAGHIESGLLHVDGRRGEMIITGGENVWPDAVERVLVQHPLVAECAVAGVEDDEWGQRVVAWIVTNANDAPSLETIREFVAQSLPRFCAPRQIIIVDTLPRTALGKVRRQLLVDELTSPR
ncbi:MAG: hypothetical protein EBV24_06790 [Actinobacteria bacterium]|nr:hypothetical protein [Actinomycetota bacterium]